MKNMKKLFAILISMIMILGMSVTAFADGAKQTADILVTGLSENVATTVKLYQIATLKLDQTTNEYSWELAQNVEGVAFDKSTNAYIINDATALKASLANLAVKETKTATKGQTEVTFTGLPVGAYIIDADDKDATYGLLVANTYDYGNSPSPVTGGVPVAKDVQLVAKAEQHTITKEADDAFVRVGQTVNFTLKTTFPTYKNEAGEVLNNFSITDTPEGVAINKSKVLVKIGTTDVTAKTAITVAGDGKMTISFGRELLTEANAGQLVTVTYQAVVTDEEGYNNEAGAESNTVSYKPSKTRGYTADITLTKYNDYKTDAEKVVLKGAEFNVKKGSETLYFVKESEGVYKLANADVQGASQTIIAPEGTVQVKGLDEGTYKFIETKAPSGYSINKDGVEVTVRGTDSKNESYPISMKDTKLSALPETGGIGTTIFTVGGCAIMILAAALFFTNRRKSDK